MARGIPATPLLVTFSVSRMTAACSHERSTPAACAMNRVAIPRWIVLPFMFRLRLSGVTTPRMRRGTPNRCRFSSVWGRAAALEVVAKPTRKGSRMWCANRRSGMPNVSRPPASTTSRKNPCASQATAVNSARPSRPADPPPAIAFAAAANTARGARYIT